MLTGGATPSKPAPSGTTAPKDPVAPCDKIHLVQVVEVVSEKAGTAAPADKDRAIVSRDQYINMPAEPNKPELGRKIRFRAQVQWVSGSTQSLAGKTVYWYFTPDGGNRAGLKTALQAGLGAAGTLHTTSSTDAQGWTTVVAFIPSQYGGDKFEVFATDDAGYKGGLSAGKYTVWRRLFYELDCMTRPEGGSTYSNRADTAGMTSKLKALFVDPVSTGTDGSPAHVRMIGENDISPYVTRVRDGTGAPRYFHLVLIDTIAWDPAPQTKTFTCGAGNDTIVLTAATYLLQASSWFRSATCTQGTVHNLAIPVGNLTLSETGTPAGGDDAFVISVSWAGLAGLDPTKAISVTLTFTNWSEGSGLQIPNGPATIIGIRWRERVFRASAGDIGNSTLNTMLHEPGHAMGLAPKTLPDGTANADQYNQAGSHCHEQANACVMFESNSVHTDFGPHCSDGLRGRNLASLPVDGNAAF